MKSWPRLDRDPVCLHVLPGQDFELWATLIELCALLQGHWTLVGGQMVLLHAVENDVDLPRVSTDLDILVNAAALMRFNHATQVPEDEFWRIMQVNAGAPFWFASGSP